MTLKNSFLTDAFENMKRRNWVFWLSFLTFLCYFPGFLVLSLNNIRSGYEKVTDPAGLIRMQERMDETVEAVFCLNGFTPVIIIGLAVLLGMQGFVYLHNKRQVDFYHSQPVSRKRRFAVLWINGIVIFAVTYLINMVLGMGVAAVYGSLSGKVLTGALEGFFLYFLLFLGIYHISIIAVLLTGNTLVSLLAMVVLLGYELAARAMTVVMASGFFITYGTGEEEKIFDTLLSPIVTIYKYIVVNNNNSRLYTGEIITLGKAAWGLFLLAVIFGLISFFLYQRRASESHGNSISFPRIKEVLRFALLLLIGTVGTYVIYYVAGESMALGIMGAVFFIGLGHAVIQLIYEVDFRAIRKKWLTAAISLLSVILVFLGFKYDWTGYDSRIPKQSRVESVSISLIAEGFRYNNYVMMDGTEVYHSYREKWMEITELEPVYELLENRERIKMATRDFDGIYETMDVTFRLKNGKTENRRLYLKYEENFGLLDEIYHMEEYQLAKNQVMEENFVENYRIISATYDNGIKNVTEPMDVDVSALIEAYKKDVKNGSYTEVYYDLPIAQITLLGIGIQNEEYRNAWNILIYESYKNTIALLEKAGIDINDVFNEAYVNSVQKIEVHFEDSELLRQSGPETVMLWEDCHKTAIYTNPESFKKILEDAVPSSNRWWCNRSRSRSNGYSIYVYTPNPYDDSDYYMDEIYFQTGEMPQFIIDDLEKIPFGEEKVVD